VAALLQSLIESLAESLLEKGVEGSASLAGARALRRICAVLIAAISAWAAVASALLWTSSRVPAVHGLVQYVLTGGGPFWELALPVVAALLTVLMLLPVPGKFTLGWLPAAAVFGLAIGALAEFQGGGQFAVGAIDVASAIPTIPMALLCIGLALGDVPPLDSPVAPLALTYWRRRKHLLALREYGRQRNLHVSGPGGKGAALTVAGQYDGQHRVVITSSVKQSVSGSATYTVNVRMSSPRDILAFRISYSPAPQRANRPIFAGHAVGPAGKPIVFYLAPEHGEQLSPAFMRQMTPIVEAGRPFLGPKDFLTATPWGMQYVHVSQKGLKVADAQLDPLVGWMRQLIAVLEPVSPGPQPSAGQAPYGVAPSAVPADILSAQAGMQPPIPPWQGAGYPAAGDLCGQ
jgi:hypothetical protein